MAVLRHAIRERPNFRVGPVFRQGKHVLEKVDLCGRFLSRARQPKGVLSVANSV